MIESDRFRADFCTYFWFLGYSALQLVLMREKGRSAIVELKSSFIGEHGARHFREGLVKLGVENDPPAVAAAKYHYLSNCSVGGIPMEYVYESDKKAWIRYLSPSIAYSGTGLFACPAGAQLGGLNAWHRLNGLRMGSSRLGYVCTKLYQFGEPYDEGYFIEYDHEISLDEAFRFEPVSSSPDFDAAAAPKLDADAWPDARLYKARRRYAEGYVAGPIEALIRLYGSPFASFVIEQAFRGIGSQYATDIQRRLGVAGADARSLAELFRRILVCTGDTAETQPAAGGTLLVRSSFAPVQRIPDAGIHDALFGLFVAITRVLTPRVRLTRTVHGSMFDDRQEHWLIEDTADRQF